MGLEITQSHVRYTGGIHLWSQMVQVVLKLVGEDCLSNRHKQGWPEILRKKNDRQA